MEHSGYSSVPPPTFDDSNSFGGYSSVNNSQLFDSQHSAAGGFGGAQNGFNSGYGSTDYYQHASAPPAHSDAHNGLLANSQYAASCANSGGGYGGGSRVAAPAPAVDLHITVSDPQISAGASGVSVPGAPYCRLALASLHELTVSNTCWQLVRMQAVSQSAACLMLPVATCTCHHETRAS